MNRQNAAARRKFFFSFVTRTAYFDATIHPALEGDARRTEKNPQNKICKFKTLLIPF
jgi:hypothetical protein